MSEQTVIPQSEPGSPMEQYERAIVAQILLAFARSLKEDNLSLAAVATLYLLDLKGPMRVGELAEALAMQLPGASKVAADLVTQGMCDRHDDPADRRAKVISIAAKGRKMIESMTQRRVAEVPLALDHLDLDVLAKFGHLFRIIDELGLTKAPR